MKTNEAVSWGVNGVGYIFSIAQTQHIFQIVGLIFSILASLVLIAYRLWIWWKEAKKDSKIDKEEIKEAVKIVKDGISEISSDIKESESKKDSRKE